MIRTEIFFDLFIFRFRISFRPGADFLDSGRVSGASAVSPGHEKRPLLCGEVFAFDCNPKKDQTLFIYSPVRVSI